MTRPDQADMGQGARPQEDDSEIDLMALARTLWRGKWWIALATALGLVIGYLFYQAADPRYTATAQMALQLQNQGSVVDIEAVVSGVSSDQNSINTEMEVIRSRELIARLVRRLDLVADPEFNPWVPAADDGEGLLDPVRDWLNDLRGIEAVPPPPPEEQLRAVVSNVRNAISANAGRGTFTFTISATTGDRLKSQLMANTLAEIYRQDQIDVKVETTESAATWLSERVSELQAELEQRQNDINALRSSNALISEEGMTALSQQAVELRTRLQQAQALVARLEEQQALLEAAEASGDIETMIAAAGDGQLEAIAVSVTSGDANAQARFDRRFDQLVLQNATELERARNSVAQIMAESDRFSSQYEGQSDDLVQLQQMERESEATRVLYETFLTRLRETTVQQGIHQADSRILSEATPGRLVAPNRNRILALSFILGLMAGSGLVLLREFLQNTFRTAEDLERRSGYPVLGQIPKIPARTRPGTIDYLREKPTSAAAEAVRNLRTSVLLSNVDTPPRVIMSTSSIPGEGKTTIAIALAQNLAGLEKKVLLVEADIRRRTFNAYFPKAADKGGILSVIAGEQALEDAVHRPEGMNVDVLMGQKSNINAADVLSSDRFRDLMTDLRTRYDYVIIDTPPVLVVPDARVIAQHSDAVIYAVRWDSTARGQVDEGLKQFHSVRANVTGVVLSQIDPKGMKRYGYGGKYGAYSRYGQGYYEA